MKWKTSRRNGPGSTKTFLVLPLLADSDVEMNKNTNLTLFTKTWPPKNEAKDENTRPLTATLERPQVLDIRLIGKIDMSLVRKEFLTITNLCRLPLTTMKPRRATAVLDRRRPISNLPVAISPKQLKRIEITSDEDECSLSSRSIKLKSKIRPPAIIPTKAKLDRHRPDEINNNLKTLARKCRSESSTKLVVPEPCTTCGRPDLPERFHSHPATPLKPIKRAEERVAMKKSVQKPTAMKYKSKLESKGDAKKTVVPAQQKVVEGVAAKGDGDGAKAVKASKGPRTLTCYLCGREFGTMSLPLHEPKCLEKWERENATLPRHLRKKPPPKPDHSLGKEEWNRLAWEAAQSALVECQHCRRTFYPDRLIVHQRSCKQPIRGQKKLPESVGPSDSNNGPPAPLPSTVQCAVCGKLFGTKSIKIHEPQCLKKWHLQNDHLPPDQKEPFVSNKEMPPVKQRRAEKQPPKPEEDRPPSAKRPPMFPCYLCGRLFGVSSIYIHEPQCLKKWRLENDQLPPHKRRQEPLKPEIKFTQDGKLDFKATEDANWQTHLSQLVPCQLCKRTFNPDRVEVHERSCKGPNQ